LDPVFVAPDGPQAVQRSWRPYFSVVVRHRALHEFATTEGGPTENGDYHRQLASTPGSNQLIVGAHVGNARVACHVTYYRYADETEVSRTIGSTLSWVNVSLEHRF
jgi:hypothetical protein